ncbi:protein IN CHLOROPLAST ATPASE BIOGENESIS, chloroplastic isoform X2 [Manihot esculenta]|uniref:protein IN CHLOROPLAST ATPASE BIOGENESIS, chloroplastic isoform X2 n=1 Tax=Manihot esculenta TaxID=3983 RepID=UPI001CC48295|nr:protein IN CHLOROPLAST ATPASE BIOGENESIS, chloroplastic isoform X2 [Manihot esculenta]
MNIGGGVVFGAPRATSLRFCHRIPTLRSFSSPCASPSSFTEHVSFIRDVAAAEPPKHLSHLLRLLKTRGEAIISPEAKQGLIPLVVPLAKNSSADAGASLYTRGDFAKSQISDLDAYLLRKVGLFPDVLERKVIHHLEKGDYVSALVTGEFYTKKEHFPGFARPFVFNAEVLLKVGRKLEAKDAARGALKSPWWTLGCRYQEVAQIAEWDDEQIEYIKERVTEESRQEDLNKGKDPTQIALDEAAFLLDLASLEGTWDDYLERIAACYKEAGLPDIARFVESRD